MRAPARETPGRFFHPANIPPRRPEHYGLGVAKCSSRRRQAGPGKFQPDAGGRRFPRRTPPRSPPQAQGRECERWRRRIALARRLRSTARTKRVTMLPESARSSGAQPGAFVQFVQLPLGGIGIQVRRTLANRFARPGGRNNFSPSTSARPASCCRWWSIQRMPKVSAASTEACVSSALRQAPRRPTDRPAARPRVYTGLKECSRSGLMLRCSILIAGNSRAKTRPSRCWYCVRAGAGGALAAVVIGGDFQHSGCDCPKRNT